MEIRVLKYFLEIARFGNMTKAAENLYVSQPALSKQMKDLEKEIGKKLFIRDGITLSLTDEGMLLRKRAEEILTLVDKTEKEFKNLDDITGGDVYLGCAETYQLKFLVQIFKDFKEKYPNFKFHIISGDTSIVLEKLQQGIVDFAILAETPNIKNYNYLEFPKNDIWGLVVNKENPISNKPYVTIDDLVDLDLIISEQASLNDMPRWCADYSEKLNYIGFTNLAYNGSIFATEKLGCLLTFQHLVDLSEEKNLCFIPLEPSLETKIYFVWKKYQIFTPIANLLLKEIKDKLK